MKRKLKKELKQVSDDARLIDVRGKGNGWGLSVNLDDRGTLYTFGRRITAGDVIIGRTGEQAAVVTEAERKRDPDDMWTGRWVLLSPEATEIVLARNLSAAGIAGLL